MSEIDEPESLPTHVVDALASTPPVDASVREAHMRAALAAFDALQVDSEPLAEVVSIASRRRMPAVLGVAAAALIVVAVGITITRGPEVPTSTSREAKAAGRPRDTDPLALTPPNAPAEKSLEAGSVATPQPTHDATLSTPAGPEADTGAAAQCGTPIGWWQRVAALGAGTSGCPPPP